MQKKTQRAVWLWPPLLISAGLLGIFRIMLGKGHHALDYLACISILGLLCAAILLIVNGIDLANRQISKLYRDWREVRK